MLPPRAGWRDGRDAAGCGRGSLISRFGMCQHPGPRPALQGARRREQRGGFQHIARQNFTGPWSREHLLPRAADSAPMESILTAVADAAAEPLVAVGAATELPKEPPAEVMLMPARPDPVRDHRPPWRLEDPEAVVDATRALGELPIDYEHQGERSEQNGQPAPAAAWIEDVFVRDGAIWGKVEWTERAAAMIRAREYRYLSPLFQHTRDRRITRLRGAGLTNDRAFDMPALARAETTGAPMTAEQLKKLRKALSLPADAGEEKILEAAASAAAAHTAIGTIAAAVGLDSAAEASAVATAVTESATGLKAVAKAAGLEEGAKASEIETAVKEARATASASGDPDPSKFVPRAEFDRVSERLKAVEDSTAEEKATASVDAAVTAGKIAPAQRDWALSYAKTDPAGFATYVEKAPAIVAPGDRTVPPGSPAPDPDAELTADELATARAMGIEPEKFKESRKRLHDARGTA